MFLYARFNIQIRALLIRFYTFVDHDHVHHLYTGIHIATIKIIG